MRGQSPRLTTKNRPEISPCVLSVHSLPYFFFLFQIRSFHIFLAVLVLARQPRLTTNSKQSSCLRLPFAGIRTSLSTTTLPCPVCLISGRGTQHSGSSASECSPSCFPLHQQSVGVLNRPQPLKAFPLPMPFCYLHCPGWGVLWMVGATSSPPLGSGLQLLILLACSKLQRQLTTQTASSAL